MGNDQAKAKKLCKKGIDKSKLDILLKQIYFTAQLNKDRRKGQKNSREKELLNLLREPANKRNKDNEYHKASAIVNDLKWIKAQECVMRYAEILKDNQLVIQMSKGDATKIDDLIPYVESLIWGCQKGNLDCVKQFQEFISGAFGADILAQLCTFTKVTSELKNCYNSILPTQKEVKAYLYDLCNRHGISLEKMNEIGHNLSADDIDDNDNNQPKSSPSEGPANSGSPSVNYPPAGYAGGFQQPNYYPEAYSQPNFPSGNYPNFPQGFSKGNPQAYAANYPQFEGYAPSSSHSSSDEPYRQTPAFNIPGPSNINLNTNFEQASFGQQDGQGLPNSSDNKYPAFPKFTDNPARKIGGDPLDELDIRLGNIKKGL